MLRERMPFAPCPQALGVCFPACPARAGKGFGRASARGG